jgi:hypothetical protein
MIPIDEVVYFDVITSDPTDEGAAIDADSAPLFDVFEEATDTPILDDQTMTKRTSLTGNYRGTFTASAANGFEAGKWYSVVVTAIVGAKTGKCVAKNFRIAPAESSAGVPKVDLTHVAGATTNVAALATNVDAILTDTAEIGAAGAGLTNINLPNQTMDIVGNITGNLSGSVGSVTGLTAANLDATISSRATPAQVNTEADTALADVGLTTTVTGRIDAAVSSRASAASLATAQTSIDDLPTSAELTSALAAADDATLAAIAALNNLSSAQAQTAAAAALTAYDPPTNAEMEARTLTAALIAKLTSHLGGVLTGVAAAGGTTTALVLNATTGINAGVPSATNDFYNGRVIVFLTGTLAGQATDITDYVGSTVTMTITAVTSAPQAGDTFIVV